MRDSPTASFATGRVAFNRNLLTSLLVMGVSLLINLWFVPFLVKHLGEDRYGFVPMATQLIALLGVVTTSFQLASVRFLTIALEKEKEEKAQYVFSSVLLGCFLFSLGILGISVFVVIGLDWALEIPARALDEVRGLFGLALGSLVLSSLIMPLGMLMPARNRVDWHNLLGLLQRVGRVLFTVLAFYWVGANLWWVGWGIMVAVVLEGIGLIWVWKRLAGSLQISFRKAKGKVIREIIQTGGWSAISLVGASMLLGVDLFVVNHCLGPELTSRYALVIQWAILFQLLASSLVSVLHPTLIRLYAKDKKEEILLYLQRSIKFVGYVLAIGVGLLCGFAQPFLELWLGAEFKGLWLLFWVVLGFLAVNFASVPLYSITLAADKVKIPALVAFFSGLLSLVLIGVFVQWFSWGLLGAAFAVVFSRSLNSIIVMPFFTAHVLKQTPIALYSAFIKVLFASVVALFSAYGVAQLGWFSNWIMLGLGMGVTGLFLGGVFYRFGLRQEDREEFKRMIGRRE